MRRNAMEMSQQRRNGLFLAGLTLAVSAFYVARMAQTHHVEEVLKPTILQAPRPLQHDTAFEEAQRIQWSQIFDPRSSDSQRAMIIAADQKFQSQPNSQNALALKQHLVSLYDTYKSTAQYERALAVLNRILELDGSIGTEEYWHDKNELALAHLRARENKEADAVINDLFSHVPSNVSAQQHLKGILDYYLQSDRADDALALLYRMVRHDKEHEWPLFLGYKSFVRLAEEFEEQDMPTKAQEVYDLGLNVEVHRNQPFGQAQIMQRYAGFQERRGMKEQADTLHRNAELIMARVSQDDRYTETNE
jgi:tetratricopeptide (TPR) repeat protein